MEIPKSTLKCLDIKHFGRYTVKSIDETKAGFLYLVCECQCGKIKSVRRDSLLNGESKSCGCLAKDQIKSKSKSSKNGVNSSTHPLYSVLHDIHRRCYDDRRKDYKYYGGRGIEVCERWNKRTLYYFDNFVEDMYSTYEEGLEIERLDVNKNYSPDNCVWVDRRSQTNNNTVNRILTGWGLDLTVSEWAHLLEIEVRKLLDDRVNHCKQGDSIEEFLKTPLRDRSYTILYKGQIVSASYIFKEFGITNSGSFIQNHGGDSLKALEYLNIDFELLKPRNKDYLDFETAVNKLKKKEDKSVFDKSILYKISKQLKRDNTHVNL